MTAPTWADRVQEIFSTTGTGTISLGGAVTGYQPFSAKVANAGTCYYCATDGTNWEVGLGTYTTSGNTLARTTVEDSSNGGNHVNFAAGTKNIWLTFPAIAIPGPASIATTSVAGTVIPDGTIITVDGSGNITVPEASSSTFGVAKVDGTTLTASSGVITAATATSGQKGMVQPDNSTITISGGVISAVSSGSSLMTALAVGSVILGQIGTGTASAGGSVAASNLTAVGLNPSTGVPTSTGNTLAGTWQALQNTGAAQNIIPYQRIA